MGDKFGVIDLGYEYSDKKHAYHKMQCLICDTIFINRKYKLKTLKSCGCREGNYKHGCEIGRKKTVELRAYHKMKERCYNKNNKDYKNYGERGIVVCPRWLESFKNFLEDMGHRPSDKHSIDRIDVNGDYSPDNCRWTTKREQSRNTRTNKIIEFGGTSMCLVDWLEETKTARTTYYRRIGKGMTETQALGLE